LRRTSVTAGQHKAGAKRSRGFPWRWKLASIVVVRVDKVQMLRSRPLERRDALVPTAHSLGSRRRSVRGCAVGHVSVGYVSPAGRRRLLQLMMQAQGWLAAHCLCRANALTVRTGGRVAHIFGVERAVTEERCRSLIALLLEALGAHGSKETVGSQRNMGSTSSCRRAALAQTTCDAHAASPSRRCWLRPSSLAARVRGRDGGRARRWQRRLADWAGHAQHAAARRAALLFNRRHRRSVVVVKVAAGILMTSIQE
jgi:hypothetical protein